MAAIRQDFTIWRGAPEPLEFTVTDDDGNPVDIAGWTAVLTLRAHSSDPDPPAFSKAGQISGVTTDGVFRVTPTKAESLTIPAGRYQHTFERSNSGSERVLTYGVATVRYDLVNGP